MAQERSEGISFPSVSQRHGAIWSFDDNRTLTLANVCERDRELELAPLCGKTLRSPVACGVEWRREHFGVVGGGAAKRGVAKLESRLQTTGQTILRHGDKNWSKLKQPRQESSSYGGVGVREVPLPRAEGAETFTHGW